LKLSQFRSSMSTKFRFEKIECDILLLWVQATQASEAQRNAIIRFIQRIVGETLTIHGSFPLKTYLPDSNIDLQYVPSSGESDVTGLLRIHESLSRATLSPPPTTNDLRIRNVTIFNGMPKVVRSFVGNVAVSVFSSRSSSTIRRLTLFEEVDRILSSYKTKHLFKRSVLLVKAWCLYESAGYAAQYGHVPVSVLCPEDGGLCSYAISLMVLSLFVEAERTDFYNRAGCKTNRASTRLWFIRATRGCTRSCSALQKYAYAVINAAVVASFFGASKVPQRIFEI
jgi:hypothetical protein